MSASIKCIKPDVWHFLGRFIPMKKPQKNRRFFIPLALAKIILVLIILHFFFSSCESILYNGETYSEGPLVEVPATFGDDEQVYAKGDTVYLEIALDDLTFEDKLSGVDVLLNDATFHTEFVFVTTEGQPVFPRLVTSSAGVVDSIGANSYMASFGLIVSNKGLYLGSTSKDWPHLKLGFVFDTPGDYTLYFVNTPNNWMEGEVDVFYNLKADTSLNIKKAYANYLFAKSGAHYSTTALTYAGSDNAIVNFQIVTNN